MATHIHFDGKSEEKQAPAILVPMFQTDSSVSRIDSRTTL